MKHFRFTYLVPTAVALDSTEYAQRIWSAQQALVCGCEKGLLRDIWLPLTSRAIVWLSLGLPFTSSTASTLSLLTSPAASLVFGTRAPWPGLT